MPINKKIYIIGLCFGKTHLKGMIEVSKEFCSKNFPNISPIYVIVDNKSSSAEMSVYSNVELISGNNEHMEFSGWQVGLNYIAKKYVPSKEDVCLLINDTIHRRSYVVGGERYYDNFILPPFFHIKLEQWAAGYLDDFPKEVSLNGLTFKSWIRSNFILFNWACVDFIDPLVFPIKDSDLFEDNMKLGFWKKSAPISENWKAYISSWLFGEKNDKFPEYTLEWLKSNSLNVKNRDFFRKKAMSILSEHYLTARLKNNNIEIFDFNTYEKNHNRHTTPYYN